jgi:hypothetical protein
MRGRVPLNFQGSFHVFKNIKTRRAAAAVTATVALGIGSAVWATSASAATSATPPACTNGNLAVWVNIGASSGAAGTIYAPLEFTNTSSHACRLDGYPGVSATDDAGKQLGDAATKDPIFPARSVTIPAGGTAHVLFGYVEAEVTTSGCKTATAAFLKVYPPNQKGSDMTFYPLAVCTTPHHPYLSVSVVQPGTNI